jgi:hypothetical protein
MFKILKSENYVIFYLCLYKILVRVGGMCHKPHACVIGELGVTTETGKPYPSAGIHEPS